MGNGGSSSEAAAKEREREMGKVSKASEIRVPKHQSLQLGSEGEANWDLEVAHWGR